MKRDIGKLADRLVELGREGIAIERKILEWKVAEREIVDAAEVSQARAS